MAKIKTMNVKAAPGTKCPMEGAPRKYITDAEAVDVPYTAYYIRRMADGSLVAGAGPALRGAAAPESGGDSASRQPAAPSSGANVTQAAASAAPGPGGSPAPDGGK